MKMLKQTTHLSLVLLLPLLLTGCSLGKKKVVKETKHITTKKVALYDKGHGLPLTKDGKEVTRKHHGKDLEAFVIKDKEDELLMSNPILSPENHVSHSDAHWVREKNSGQEFEPVLFAFNSTEIREKEKPKLKYDIEHAKQAVDKGYTIVVEGHADSKCKSPEYNVAISEQRAKVGAHELEKAGVPHENIKIVAYGDNKKIVDTLGKEERNRRVEFVKVSHDDVIVS